MISPDGTVGPMTAALRAQLEETTTGMASRGLRTLCITYRDFPADAASAADFFETAPDTELTCCAIVGIKVLGSLTCLSKIRRNVELKLQWSKMTADTALVKRLTFFCSVQHKPSASAFDDEAVRCAAGHRSANHASCTHAQQNC